MSKNSEDTLKRIHEFFSAEPDAEEKAWGLIHEFYHQVLTYMEEKHITRANLSKKLGKSRSAITQIFNKTPNISVLKMVEIADAVGVDLVITTRKKIETVKTGTRAGASQKAAAGSSGRYIAPPAPNQATVIPPVVRDRQIGYPASEIEKGSDNEDITPY